MTILSRKAFFALKSLLFPLAGSRLRVMSYRMCCDELREVLKRLRVYHSLIWLSLETFFDLFLMFRLGSST
jgi:hypothetical protein